MLGEEEAVALLCSVGSSVSWCPVLHEEYWASDLMRLLQPEGEESRIENLVAVCLCPIEHQHFLSQTTTSDFFPPLIAPHIITAEYSENLGAMQFSKNSSPGFLVTQAFPCDPPAEIEHSSVKTTFHCPVLSFEAPP